MAVVSKQILLVLLALVAQLAQHRAQPIPTQYSNIQRSCPPGWAVLGVRVSVGYNCVLDPCYGANSPCGPGNTCTTINEYPNSLTFNCTCNPPYNSGVIPSASGHQICYQPGQDACSSNPCANGGTCSYITDRDGNPIVDAAGTKYAFQCDCTNTGFYGTACSTPVQPIPGVTASVNGVTGPLAKAIPDYNVCGTRSLPPVGCLYADNAHFLCCNDTSNCGPTGPDGVPVCPGPGYVPTPNNYPVSTPAPTSNPPGQSPPGPSGDQGVCGSGAASSFPTRCYFNSDPQGRYVCCDSDGCNGFNADNLFPHCKTNGYVPPNYGLSGPTPPSGPPSSPPSSPPSAPPTGDQGVCGSGAATDFPTRCWFNSDPLGRYVCCDNNGCNGFNSDNLTPNCAKFGYVPPNYGLSGQAPPSGPPSSPPSGPPSSPPSGDQGVCGSGDATYFPNRCWFNNDPQGRYVCCDKDGCNGFNPPDYLFPRCQTNGYVPPSFGT